MCALLSMSGISAHGAFSVVLAAGSDGYVPSLYANARSVTAAKQLATAGCVKYLTSNRLSGKCSVFFSGMGPGYVAVVAAVPGSSAMGAAVALSRKAAIDHAYALCRNGNQYVCKTSPEFLVWDGGQQGLAEPQVTSAIIPATDTSIR